MTKAQALQQQEAIERLREMIKPGETLHTILRSVSRSGMTRHISVLHGTNEITHLVARALDLKRADDGGVKVGGCGMDMGFHVVYELSHALWPEGFECAGERCPANDHSNGDRNYAPHMHRDGGYAINQRWL
jgi:hypothetical protein